RGAPSAARTRERSPRRRRSETSMPSSRRRRRTSARSSAACRRGAQKLSALWAKGADPRQDLHAVRIALAKMRREVPDLTVAKSTFFAIADEKGIAIRNDLEEAAWAWTALLPLFPELAKAEAGNYVATTGAFPGPPLPSGPDKDWLAAVP